MLHITPRLGELDSPDISIEDIASFYSIDGVAVSDTRPYTWTNSVTTLDGIIHFGDESMVGPLFLGLEGASDGSDTDPLQVWVVTTSLGAAALEHRMQPYRNSGQLRSVVKIIVGEDVSVNAATADNGIRYLDVSAGGSVIRKCIDLRLLNETRLTLAGHVAGPFDMGGNMRPGLFPVDSDRFKSYGPDRSPLLAMRALRMGGDHLMFVRGEWTYR
ncbi:hypothetical protein BSLG_000014 [Batrachochytrium salamandrivorans]|nr:hypothetical protein BSLG_000014 [Batrachochytrium salamandrivorans]